MDIILLDGTSAAVTPPVPIIDTVVSDNVGKPRRIEHIGDLRGV
jgi:hypothetical protein